MVRRNVYVCVCVCLCGYVCKTVKLSYSLLLDPHLQGLKNTPQERESVFITALPITSVCVCVFITALPNTAVPVTVVPIAAVPNTKTLATTSGRLGRGV